MLIERIYNFNFDNPDWHIVDVCNGMCRQDFLYNYDNIRYHNYGNDFIIRFFRFMNFVDLNQHSRITIQQNARENNIRMQPEEFVTLTREETLNNWS